MIQSEVLVDRLTRANERIKMLDEVEAIARQVDGLKAKWKALTGQETI